jgi:5-methyltetrahydropteroyltriglutamate--homocysteine methyltransferase
VREEDDQRNRESPRPEAGATARPAGIVLEACNPRHEHEWQVFKKDKLSPEKVMIPGVIDTVTNFVEHPELVAQCIEH